MNGASFRVLKNLWSGCNLWQGGWFACSWQMLLHGCVAGNDMSYDARYQSLFAFFCSVLLSFLFSLLLLSLLHIYSCLHMHVWQSNDDDYIQQIQLFDDEFKRLIESKEVGIGQLFRYFHILPSFSLNGAGKRFENGFDGKDTLWREYELSCPQMRCHFVETFVPGFLDFTLYMWMACAENFQLS